MSVADAYEKAINDALRNQVREALDQDARERVREALVNWISFTATLRKSADLTVRLEDFRKRIERLADTVELDIGPEGYVVRASGDAEVTLQMLRRGTGWFNPADNPDVNEMIVGAILA